MMMVDRGGQAEQVLQNDMDRRGRGKVFAPDHMGDVLGRVIQYHGKMVRAGEIPA